MLTPTTPSSHVAILAWSYQVPFSYFIREKDRLRARQLTNRVVVLQTCPVAGAGRALLVEVDDTISPEDRSRLEGLRAPVTLNLTPKRPLGMYSVPTETLTPTDIATVGGKAVNFGLLRRVIPDHSPLAIALTFDLWDDFMDQVLFGTTTLRQEISNRLAGLNYPQDIAATLAQLDGIRRLIRQGTVFTPAEEQAITNVLGVFDPLRNIRFASSAPSVGSMPAFTTTTPTWNAAGWALMKPRWAWRCWSIIPRPTILSWPMAWRPPRGTIATETWEAT